MEQEDRIIWIYVRIEEIFHEVTGDVRLRRHGFVPALSDVEVLTMEIIGEMEGKNGDRAIWRYFDMHWREWFPKLPVYKTFAKHCANLCRIKQAILARLFGAADSVHIIDGVPMPVCHGMGLLRRQRRTLLRPARASAHDPERLWKFRTAWEGFLSGCLSMLPTLCRSGLLLLPEYFRFLILSEPNSFAIFGILCTFLAAKKIYNFFIPLASV